MKYIFHIRNSLFNEIQIAAVSTKQVVFLTLVCAACLCLYVGYQIRVLAKKVPRLDMCRSIKSLSKITHQTCQDHPFRQRNKATERASIGGRGLKGGVCGQIYGDISTL